MSRTFRTIIWIIFREPLFEKYYFLLLGSQFDNTFTGSQIQRQPSILLNKSNVFGFFFITFTRISILICAVKVRPTARYREQFLRIVQPVNVPLQIVGRCRTTPLPRPWYLLDMGFFFANFFIFFFVQPDYHLAVPPSQ